VQLIGVLLEFSEGALQVLHTAGLRLPESNPNAKQASVDQRPGPAAPPMALVAGSVA
jgi:hypothetical protein